VEDHKGHPGWK